MVSELHGTTEIDKYSSMKRHSRDKIFFRSQDYPQMNLDHQVELSSSDLAGSVILH
jgi:hypothetical protein